MTMDGLLLFFDFLKHGSSFIKFGLDYGMNDGAICRMINRMLDFISKPLQDYLMD